MTVWTERDRIAQQFAEHDVAYAIVNGFKPRPEDIEMLRGAYARRDAFLAAAPTQRLTDLEAAGLGDPVPAEHLGED